MAREHRDRDGQQNNMFVGHMDECLTSSKKSNQPTQDRFRFKGGDGEQLKHTSVRRRNQAALKESVEGQKEQRETVPNSHRGDLQKRFEAVGTVRQRSACPIVNRIDRRVCDTSPRSCSSNAAWRKRKVYVDCSATRRWPRKTPTDRRFKKSVSSGFFTELSSIFFHSSFTDGSISLRAVPATGAC
jgi:hypothetical protein